MKQEQLSNGIVLYTELDAEEQRKMIEEERHGFIGGSDLPVILHNPKKYYKSLYQFSQIKLGRWEADNTFLEPYAEQGKLLEPQIRAYVNDVFCANYQVCTTLYPEYGIRVNHDGYDPDADLSNLEIKIVGKSWYGESEDLSSAPGYEYNKWQIWGENAMLGSNTLLAVYRRAEGDFLETEIDPERLEFYEAESWDGELPFFDHFADQLNAFITAYNALAENPQLTEEEFETLYVGQAAYDLADKVYDLKIAVEEAESKYSEAAEELKQIMQARQVKNIGKCTFVPATEDSTKSVLDEARFSKENPDIYKQYLIEKAVSGRAASLRVNMKGK